MLFGTVWAENGNKGSKFTAEKNIIFSRRQSGAAFFGVDKINNHYLCNINILSISDEDEPPLSKTHRQLDFLMKPSTHILRLLPVLIAGLLTAGVLSCGRHKDTTSPVGPIGEIVDSLNHGNLQAAVRLTSLLKEKSLSRNDSLLWSESMVQQGVNSYYQGNPALLLASTDSALRWLERQKVTPELAQTLAKAYQTHGAYYDQFYFNPDSTAKYLRLSVDNVELSGVAEDLPQAYGNYANAMRLGAALDSAAVYYHRAISVADSLNMETEHYIPLYNGIAAVFTDMRDFDNSRIWWGKSMEISGKMNRFDKFNTFTGVGNDLYYQQDYEGSNRIFTRLRKFLDSIPDTRWERMFADVNLADTYLRLGNLDNVTALLDSTERYFSQEQPNPMVMSYIHTLRIRDAIKNGDIRTAQSTADAHPFSDTMRLEQQLARLQILEELYTNTGDYRKAYYTRSHYDRLNDSLKSYTLSQRISALNALYQRDKKILNLEAGTTRQKAHIFQLVSVVALTLMIIVGLVLFIVLRRGRIRRREERMMSKIIALREENLRNRITPHFIYNAINHELSNSANGSPLHLDSIVSLIRRQQYVVSQILIPFSEELAFVDDYIKVMSSGSPHRLDYTYSISPDITPDFMFPSMALQILVENAFKHGFTTLRPDEDNVLRITVSQAEGDRLSVSVFNNRGSSGVKPSDGGTGLHVLVETIRLLNERNREKTRFEINDDAESLGIKGFSATITIPLSLKS